MPFHVKELAAAAAPRDKRPQLHYPLLMELADVLKALADTNRLRILNLLEGRTLCVCDLERVLKLNQSNLSRHLAKLKQAGLVTGRKQGLFMHYSRKPAPEPFRPLLDALYSAMALSDEWADDRAQLHAVDCCDPSDPNWVPLAASASSR